jgi:predicted transcriptional regulator
MSQNARLSPIPPADQEAFHAAVCEGIEAADTGRLSPLEPVAEWLASWGTENVHPTPE